MRWRGYQLVLAGIVLVTAVLSGATIHAQSTEEYDQVYTVDIEDDIKAGTARELSRAVEAAEAASADVLVVTLETPGGLLQSTREIVDTLRAAEVETLVYVDRPNGWALSAGTIVLLAADHAHMHPNASLGAAQPFAPDGDGGEVQDEKTLESTVAWVRGLAEENQRDPDVAEAFVRDNLVLSGTEALEAGMIDGTAEDFDELLVTIGAEEADVTEVQQTLIGGLFNVLSDPFFISLFLTLGGLALVLAVRSGEFSVSAGLGSILLLIGLWGAGIIEFTLIGIGLLIVGIILIMIELFDQPGFGLFGGAGIVSVFFGMVTLGDEPFFSPGLLDPLPLLAFTTLGLGVVGLAIVSRGVAKVLGRRPASGSESLIGREVRIIKELTPRGRVEVDGEQWPAVEAADAKSGSDKVPCIIRVEGNTLYIDWKQPKEREKE